MESASWRESFRRSARKSFDFFRTERGSGCAIKRYVDERVAHRHLQLVAEVPTWGEVNTAIDTMAGVHKYSSLLKASSSAFFEPVIQYDWEAPFRQAWLPWPLA